MKSAVIWDSLQWAACRAGFGLASFTNPGRTEVLKAVRAMRGAASTPLEAAQLIWLVKATAKLGGAMAEVGVYRGATAKLIRDADALRTLHLFDTFEGLPETTARDTEFRNGQFETGRFACSVEEVRKYVGSENVRYHVGLFPDSANGAREERFSFVNVDVDIYQSSKYAFEFFYPRMVRGGIIVSHDFTTCQGPRDAVTEFMNDKPEPLIELAGDQAMLVKL